MRKQHQEKAGPRETWQDWVSPALAGNCARLTWEEKALLLTRDEVVAQLGRLARRVQRDELAVDEETLRFWEKAGTLPRPIHEARWKGEHARALYPWWIVNLIFNLREYTRRGYPLEALPDRLRADARNLLSAAPDSWSAYPVSPALIAARFTAPSTEVDLRLSEYIQTQIPPVGPVSPPFVAPASLFPSGMVDWLGRWMDLIADGLWHVHGIALGHAELRLVDKYGKEITILPMPVSAPSVEGQSDGATGS